MKKSSRILSLLLCLSLFFSVATTGFAESYGATSSALTQNTQKEYRISPQELAKLTLAIEKTEKAKGQLSTDQLKQILKNNGLDPNKLASEKDLQAQNATPSLSAAASAELPVGLMLQGRTVVTDNYTSFSIKPWIQNASLIPIQQVAGWVRGYLMIYPGVYYPNVERYIDERNINPMTGRNFGVMYMPVYGKKAYYVTSLVMNNNGSTALLPGAQWNNRY